MTKMSNVTNFLSHVTHTQRKESGHLMASSSMNYYSGSSILLLWEMKGVKRAEEMRIGRNNMGVFISRIQLQYVGSVAKRFATETVYSKRKTICINKNFYWTN